MDSVKHRLVIVGAGGYWGSVLIRAAIELFGIDRVVALDVNETGLKRLAERLKTQQTIPDGSALRICADLDEALDDSSNAYFVVATPPQSHHQISMKVLRHKKHLLVTKPMALTVKGAQEIRTFAKEQGVTVMVDHTFLYNPAIIAMVDGVKAGMIGTPKTYYANWLSRGKIQDGADVIWDLAPHPLSILLEFWTLPIDVSCKVLDANNGTPTEACLFLTEKQTGNSAIVQVSWMDSDKSRTFKIRGSHHTIIFDDLQEAQSKVRIKGGQATGHPLLDEGYNAPVYKLPYLQEKLVAVRWEEPLKQELRSFIEMTQQPQTSDATYTDVACVRLLEAAQESIRQDGACVQASF